MNSIKKLFLLAFSLLLIAKSGFAQENDYRFHKVFFYSFTKYVEWPENYKDGDFVIAVIGDSEILTKLKEMAEIKKVGNRPIKVIKVEGEDLNQKINILFVSDNRAEQLQQITNKLGPRPTLIVSETSGLASQGSMINFKDVNGKLKFEVNTGEIEEKGLKVSKELLRFGEEVN